MRRIAAALAIAALAVAMPPAASEGGHTVTGQAKQAAKSVRKKPVQTEQAEPVKRQNFRARRPDEISPWEGFEDCAFGFPCVGMTAGPRF